MVNSLILLLLASSSSQIHDPTQPLNIVSPTPVLSQNNAIAPKKGLQLEAIFTGTGVSSAIIDGKLYRQGSKVGQYRLARIDADRILLQGQGGTVTLSLFPSLSNLSTP